MDGRAGRQRRDTTEDGDRGAVTVEAAIALGALAVVTALALGSVATVTASVRCVDAAREMARLAARGEPERAREIALRLAPGGAQTELRVDGEEITATVTAAPGRVLPFRVAGTAHAVLEPAAQEPEILTQGGGGP
ncbi:MAG: pilus assembly protein [Pseudonocardia sp.]|nr:pilus assembly protein [Pseudonocardia sp.]